MTGAYCSKGVSGTHMLHRHMSSMSATCDMSSPEPAKINPATQVVVLERTREAGKKVLMSGGTRCNVLPLEADLPVGVGL